MYKILIVDDEQMILKMLKRQLESEGYEVLLAESAKEALNALKFQPDLILLDINMPGTNGLELCAMVRQHITVPIIFLTARASSQDKVNGLMVGGDDYITKPFGMDELSARITAHLRREERGHQKTRISFDKKGLVIDYSGRKVYVNNSYIELSNKEFDIICLLSMHAGQVFDKETIYERIWGYEGAGDSNVIKEHVRRIRSKLSERTNEQYIETVWGVGYRWKK